MIVPSKKPVTILAFVDLTPKCRYTASINLHGPASIRADKLPMICNRLSPEYY